MATQLSSGGAQIAPVDGFSHVRGLTDVPLSEATIGQFLRDTAQRFPDRSAVVFREQRIRWTWQEFADEVEVVAAGFAALGIVKGDRVGIWSPNRVEWLLTQFATARIGAVLVNINPAYQLTELEYALNTSSCKAIVCAECFKSSRYVEMLQALAPELAQQSPRDLRIARLPSLRLVIRTCDTVTAGMLCFSELVELGRVARETVPLDAIDAALCAHDPINIQFTSGTTGNPKGATLTHRNLINNARYIAMAMHLSEADALCVPVPLYHCFGMVMAVLVCVSVGAAMVFPSEAFDAGATLAAVAEERCTVLHGVPTMFIAELAHPEFEIFDLSSLRTGIMAGAPCPIETMKQVMSRMHLPEITIAYGMTETSPISFQTSTLDPLDKRTGTVGRIQPHLEAKVLDSAGRIVPIGETGELYTKGYSVMLGYWGDEPRTRESIADGWMRTGDLAIIDAAGYCNIVGRLKDMLIRGGENVYPREIEEFLFRHPKIQSVQVFGVPDPKYGEEICAWIMLHPGESMSADEVSDFCRGQIAHFKAPRYIRFVEEMPMTVTGKVQKFVMRDQMIDELKLSAPPTA
jgi:fatty-acyl-CoA synthase